MTEYFGAWSKVISSRAKDRIAYVDLFAGPGKYQDGCTSTPLRILGTAINNPELRKSLIAILNDRDISIASELQANVNALPQIETMVHKPRVLNEEVSMDLATFLTTIRFVPTLSFIDPWGFRGLTLQLIYALLRGWGCDIIFFLNFDGIRRALYHADSQKHLVQLLPHSDIHSFRNNLSNSAGRKRESMIVEEIDKNLRVAGAKYIVKLCFKRQASNATSHYLYFVCKHHKGFEIMNGIMSKKSSKSVDGVPNFIFDPKCRSMQEEMEYGVLIEQLASELATDYSNKEVTALEAFWNQKYQRQYVKSNFKTALQLLIDRGLADRKIAEDQRRSPSLTYKSVVVLKGV